MRHLPTAIRQHAALISRVVAAVLGGYGLAALSSVAALALPMPQTEAILVGMLLSFLVFAGTVVGVFGARSARRAWTGVLVAACSMLIPVLLVWSERSM